LDYLPTGTDGTIASYVTYDVNIELEKSRLYHLGNAIATSLDRVTSMGYGRGALAAK
jgi:hypothetical protein